MMPFECNTKVQCTQGNFGDICGSLDGDHANWPEQFAWDFGDVVRGVTKIVAARSGTVVATFAPDPACVNGCTDPFGSPAFWQCCNNCLKLDGIDRRARKSVNHPARAGRVVQSAPSVRAVGVRCGSGSIPAPSVLSRPK